MFIKLNLSVIEMLKYRLLCQFLYNVYQHVLNVMVSKN